MAYLDYAWYVNFGDGLATGYYGIALRPQNTAVGAGQIVRQFTTPAVGSERSFICIIAGTTANTTDATWVLTRGSKTVDGTATWMECSGQASLNGDITNTPSWAVLKAVITTGSVTLGAIIKTNSSASYQICTTTGTMGASEPAFSNTAGVTTPETSATAVWTSLGLVGNYLTGGCAAARMTVIGVTNFFSAGNTVYVADIHNELQSGNMTITYNGDGTTINKVICHKYTGNYPPTTSADLATSAVVSSVGRVVINVDNGYIYGITFRGGVTSGSVNSQALGIASTASNWMYFDKCSFRHMSTGGGAYTVFGSGAATTIIFNDTTIYIAADSQSNGFFQTNTVRLLWRNTPVVLVTGSVVPNYIFSAGAFAGGVYDITLEGLDLSAFNSLWGHNFASIAGNITIRDCALNPLLINLSLYTSGMFAQYAGSIA